MPNHDPRHPDPAFREVKRDIARAADKQIEQVVAMIDEIPDRGAADGLIEPIRPRLAALRTAHPLRFYRLLFKPLDPVIVPIGRWRPGDPTVPRTSLMALAATVRRELGGDAAEVEQRIKGKTTADDETIAEMGAALWPKAAAILLRTPPPERWAETGLGVTLYPPLARLVGATLRQIAALSAMIANVDDGMGPPDAGSIAALLRGVQDDHRAAQSTMIALLLASVPTAGPLLAQIAGTLGRHEEATLRAASDRATTVLLDGLEMPGRIEAQINAVDLARVSADVRRLGGLLRDLDDDGAPPERRVRVAKLRQRLNASCRTRFTAHLSEEFLAPLSGLDTATAPEAVIALENVARGLRELETEARAIGGAGTYDLLLRQAADVVQGTRGQLGHIEAVRLVELLAGAEAALALL